MNKLQNIFSILSNGRYYTKTFEEFQNQMQNPDYRNKIVNILKRDKLWSDDMNSVFDGTQLIAPPSDIKKKEKTTESYSALGSSGSQESFDLSLADPKTFNWRGSDEKKKVDLKKKMGSLNIDFSNKISTPGGIYEISKELKEKLKTASVDEISAFEQLMAESISKDKASYTGFKQSSIGKVAGLISEINQGRRISDEDKKYMKERSPKAYEQLSSLVNKENVISPNKIEFTPSDDINQLADNISSANQKDFSKKSYEELQNAMSKLSEIGISPENIGKVSTKDEILKVEFYYNEQIKKLEEIYPLKEIKKYNRIEKEYTYEYERDKEYYAKVKEIDNAKSYILDQIGKIHAYKYAVEYKDATPEKVGEEYLKVVDPITYKNFISAGRESKKIMSDIDKIGSLILQSTGEDKLISKGVEAERLHDKKYPEELINETKRRIAVEYAKQNGLGYVYNPGSITIKEADKYIDQLPAKYKKAYLEKIRPYELNEGGVRSEQVFTNETLKPEDAQINLPDMGGAINKFMGEGLNTIESAFSFTLDRLSNKKDIINRALEAQPLRKTPLVEKNQLESKIKDLEAKPILTIQEANELQKAKGELGLTSTTRDVINGTFGLAGQVVAQAILTRQLGPIVGVGMRGVSIGGRAIGLANQSAKIAQYANNIKNVNDVTGGMVAFVSSYSDAQKEAINLGLDDWKGTLYATSVGTLNAVTERFFQDEKIFEAFKKEASPLIADMVRNFTTQNISEEVLRKNLRTILTKIGPKYLKNMAIENQKEAIEEVATQVGTSLVKLGLAPDQTDASDEIDAIKQTYFETTIYGTITSGLAGITETNKSRVSKKAMYSLGSSPEKVKEFIDVVNYQVASGKMSQQEADKKIKAVTDLQQIVNTSIPIINSKKEITDAEKIKLTSILLAERNLRDEINDPKFDDVKDLNQEQLSKVRELKKKILNNEVFVDDNLNVYTEKELNNNRNAIQEQTAGQVPVQPTTGVGEKVEEGVPQPKPEITPEQEERKTQLQEAIAQAGEAATEITIGEEVIPMEQAQAELNTLTEAVVETKLTPEQSKKELPEGVTITDAVDENGEPDYEAEDTLRALAKKRGIAITSDREVAQVARDADGNIIGGTFTSYNDADGKYTFDVVVDEAYEGKGIGSNLLDAVKNMPEYIAEINPDAKVEVDVVNPAMQKMLESRGFEVTKQLGEGRVLMEPKSKQQKTVSVEPIAAHEMDDLSEVEARVNTPVQKTIVRATKNVLSALKSIIPNVQVYLHENEDSYNNAVGKLGGIANSGGNFHMGSMRIDVNLSRANSRTVAHEAAHAVLYKVFGDNAKAFKAFHRSLSAVISSMGRQDFIGDRGKVTTVKKYLNNFAKRYEDANMADLAPEEYAVELSGILSSNAANLSVQGWRKIALVVRDFVDRITNGKIKLFENINDTRDVVDFFNSMSQSFKTGEAIKAAPESITKKFGRVEEGVGESSASLNDIQDLNTQEPYSSGLPIIVNNPNNFVGKKSISKSSIGDYEIPKGIKILNIANLPIKTLEEMVKKYKGRVVIITSDATGYGVDSDGEPILGGAGFASNKINVDDGIGFASLNEGTVKGTYTRAENSYGLGKVLVLIMIQPPHTTINNSYGAKYMIRGLLKIGEQSQTELQKTKESIKNFVIKSTAVQNEFKAEAKKIRDAEEFKIFEIEVNKLKKLKNKGKALTKEQEKSIKKYDKKIIENSKKEAVEIKKGATQKALFELIDKINTGADLNSLIKEFLDNTTFTLRKEIGLGIMPSTKETKTDKSTTYSKIAFNNIDYSIYNFLKEYGDKTILTEDMILNNKGGVLVGGFELDVTESAQREKLIKEIQSLGILHPLFNAKLPGTNHFRLDGLYDAKENFAKYAVPDKIIDEDKIKKEEVNNLVRETFKSDFDYNPKFRSIPLDERTYTHLSTENKTKLKNEILAPKGFLKDKEPDVATKVAKGEGFIPKPGAAKQMAKAKYIKSKASLVHDETGFVSTDFWVNNLRGNTKYLDDVIKNILDAREELKRGEVKEGKVIKAYLITLASKLAGEQEYSKWQKKSNKEISDIFFEYNNGKTMVRPEGVAAAYLITPEGKKLVQDISNGTATFEQVKGLFDFVGMGLETSKSNDVIKTMKNGGIKNMVSLFNTNKGSDFNELYNGAIKNFEGIADGKTGFFNQYFGVSQRGVIDARQLNAWVSGSMKVSPEQRKIIEKVSASKKLKNILLDRIEKVGIELGYPKDLAGYIAHHAIWDAIANSVTTHAGEYMVVSKAQLPAELEISDGWYSSIEKNLLKTKIEKQSANKWLTGDAIGKGDEAVFTGVRAFLEGKGPNAMVSKQEILDYMKDNRISVSEVVKGEAYVRKEKEYKDKAISVGKKFGFNVDFGSENEIELPYSKYEIETIRDREFISKNDDISIEALEAMVELYKENSKYAYKPNAFYDEGGDVKFRQYQLEGEKENYKEIMVILPRTGSMAKVGDYKVPSAHKYGEDLSDNRRLVHLRMNTRTDADGNKVLFLEEVQSDWGQTGKKEGFRGKKAKDTKSITVSETPETIVDEGTSRQKNNYVVFADGVRIGLVHGANKEDALSNAKKRMSENPNAVIISDKGTPTAPFVTDTKAWTKLGLKVAIKEAIRQGVDKIAWTTGEQQADRYSLRNQVDYIDVFTNDDGTYEIQAVKGNKTISKEKSLKPNQLEGLLGKDLAKKIIEDTKTHKHIPGEENLLKTYRGDDLKVGGEGMKGFYDNIVPNSAKSLVKELTGKEGVITQVKFSEPKNQDVIDRYNRARQYGNVPEQLARDYENALGLSSTQQAIDITPELKAAVERGMPLFSKAQLTEEELPGYDDMMSEVKKSIEKELDRQKARLGKTIPLDTNLDNTKYRKERLDAAINYVMQDSKAYGDADDVQREQIIRDIRKMLGFKEKSAPGAASDLFIGIGRIIKMVKEKKMVTMTDSQFFYKQLNAMLRGGRDAEKAINRVRKEISESLRGYVRTGKLSSKQAAAVLKMANKINLLKPESVSRFIDYATKVFADAAYAEKLKTGRSLRSSILSLSNNKSKNPSLRAMAKKFLQIDPSLVQNIDEYNELAEKLQSTLKGSKIIGEKINLVSGVDLLGARNFIDDSLEYQEKTKRDMLIDEINQILNGIDTDNMTESELRELVNSINENKNNKTNKYKNQIIRDALNRLFDINSSIINSMLNNGEDPFTGNPVTFTDNQIDILKRFMSMDIDMLDVKVALDVIDKMSFFIQNQGDFRSTAGMEVILQEYDGEMALRKLASDGILAKAVRKYFSPKLGKILLRYNVSVPAMFERMFKGVNRGNKVMRALGIMDAINGKAKAEQIANAIAREYVIEFFNKKANGKKFNTSANNIERGMIAFMIRNIVGTEQQMRDEFIRRKNHIEQSIDLLMNGDEKEQEKARIYQEVYNKIVAPSETIQDIMDNADQTNLNAVLWWAKKWDEQYDKMAEVASNVYNKILDKEINYTPDRYKKISYVEDKTELDLSDSVFDFNNGTMYTRESGSLMVALRLPNLPVNKDKKTNRYIDFSFDTNNSSSFYDSLVDIHTAASIRKINAVIKSDNFNKIFPDAKIVKDRLKLMINRFRNKTPFVETNEMTDLIDSLNRIASIGVGMALAGAGQPIKQVIPVALNTLINSGRLDFASMFDTNVHNFINESGYGIANRGSSAQTQIESLNRMIEEASKTKGEALIRMLEDISKFYLNIFLVQPDVYIARMSWISYYEKALAKKGIKNINYSSHILDKEAADYAETMVSRQQNISDHDLSGQLYGSSDKGLQLFTKVFAAFSGFRTNAAVRLANDLSVFEYWNTSTFEDKVIALRSLAGYSAEVVTFHFISILLSYLTNSLANSLMGIDDDEEEEKKYNNMLIKGRVTSTAVETVSPFPLLDPLVQMGEYELINVVQKFLDIDEEDRSNIFEVKPSTNMVEQIIKSLGLFGITVDRANVITKMTNLATNGSYEDKYGNKKFIKSGHMDAIGSMIPFVLMGSVNLIPGAEVVQTGRRMIKIAEKEASTNDPNEFTETELKASMEINQLEFIKKNHKAIDSDIAFTPKETEEIDNMILKRKAKLNPERDIKQEKMFKQESDREKMEEKELLGNYSSKSEMKKMSPGEYKAKFGEGSKYYKEHLPQKKIESLWNKVKKLKRNWN